MDIRYPNIDIKDLTPAMALVTIPTLVDPIHALSLTLPHYCSLKLVWKLPFLPLLLLYFKHHLIGLQYVL